MARAAGLVIACAAQAARGILAPSLTIATQTVPKIAQTGEPGSGFCGVPCGTRRQASTARQRRLLDAWNLAYNLGHRLTRASSSSSVLREHHQSRRLSAIKLANSSCNDRRQSCDRSRIVRRPRALLTMKRVIVALALLGGHAAAFLPTPPVRRTVAVRGFLDDLMVPRPRPVTSTHTTHRHTGQARRRRGPGRRLEGRDDARAAGHPRF